MKKVLAKTAVFLCIIAVSFYGISQILCYKDDTHTKALFETFYRLPKNSVDVVWVGASAVQTGVIPPQLWAESGVTVYPLATAGQSFAFAKYMITECEKTQDPQLYFVDLRMLAYEADVMGNEIMSENYIRHLTDCMRHSRNRSDLILFATDELKKAHPEEPIRLFDYYVGFTKYHNRWSELTAEDFGRDRESYMGWYAYEDAVAFNKEETLLRHQAQEAPLSDNNKRYLEDFLSYCDTLDKPVVFTCIPSNQEEAFFGQYNYAKRKIRERGYDVLDFNDHVNEMGFDYRTDFCESMHLNVNGAVKLSTYAGKYLKNVYGIVTTEHSERDRMYQESLERFRDAYGDRL